MFTDQDFLAASLMAHESEQIAENQDPNAQNFEDAQSDGMVIISGLLWQVHQIRINALYLF